jgi:hypothetical protein
MQNTRSRETSKRGARRLGLKGCCLWQLASAPVPAQAGESEPDQGRKERCPRLGR